MLCIYHLFFFYIFYKIKHKRALYSLHSEYISSTLNIRHSAVYSATQQKENYKKILLQLFEKVNEQILHINPKNISGILQFSPVCSCLFLIRKVPRCLNLRKICEPRNKRKMWKPELEMPRAKLLPILR